MNEYKNLDILLVEDSDFQGKYFRECLEEGTQWSYAVSWAKDLASAIQVIADKEVDVILLDLNLPDSVGAETFFKLYGCSSKIPIIILTIIDHEEMVIKLLEQGASDYLDKKSVNPIRLHRAIRHVTYRRKAEEANQRKSEQLKIALKEKEILLREVNHRVKNSLAVVSGLLKLQANCTPDKKAKEALLDSQFRVQSMSAIHEMLHQTETMSVIDLDIYLTRLVKTLAQHYRSNGNIELSFKMENFKINVNQASPLGLIVNELITNSYKYAFPDNRKGEIRIGLKRVGQKQIQLDYADDGVGMPEGLNWKNAESLGLKLILMLIENQLDGSIEMKSDPGTSYFIKFEMDDP
jgi:two-component sensor histidine kinase